MAGVLITGGSRGLGAALARRFVARGDRVALVARHEPELREVAEAVGAHAIVADVGEKDAIHAIAGQAAAMLGEVDVVVQNASTLGPLPMPLLLDTACEDLAGVLETNLVGPFRLSKALLPGMILRGRGVLLFVSSDAAVNGYPGWGAYGVSKAALDQLARTWAAELEGTGVRVLSADPGEMDTRMHADAVPDADPTRLAKPDAAARWMIRFIDGASNGTRGAR